CDSLSVISRFRTVDSGQRRLAPGGDAFEKGLVADLVTELSQLVAPRAEPSQIVERLEQRNIRAQCREMPIQPGLVAMFTQALGQCFRAADRQLPTASLVGNRVDVLVDREHGGRRLRPPTRYTWIAVGAVADERQPVGNRRRRYAELRDDAVLVEHAAPHSIEGDDLRPAYALSHVRVGRADHHALDAGRGAPP